MRVPYDEHSKVKELLSKYAPLMKWQRSPDSRPVGQPKYETEHYHLYNREDHINELETLISRYFIEIKDSLTLALECESKASFHHFNIGMKLRLHSLTLCRNVRNVRNKLIKKTNNGLLTLFKMESQCQWKSETIYQHDDFGQFDDDITRTA